MSNVEIVILVTLLTAAIGITLFVALPLLKSKGYDIANILKRIEDVLNGLNGAIEIASEVAPKNKFVEVLEYIKNYDLLKKGFEFAAQLYISSQLAADQRKTAAVEYVINALKFIGVDVTSELLKYIEGGIEAIIYASKTQEEIKLQLCGAIQNQVSQLQQQNSQLQSTNTQLTQENTQLKSTIATVQQTLTP